MTHSLHRRGSLESLEHDFVWQPYPAQNINDKNLSEKFSTIIDIVEDLESINWGDIKTGPKVAFNVDQIKNRLTQKSRIRGVFTEKTQVVEFLQRMKKLDTGLSLVISGITEEVLDACREVELKPHSINLSLGIWGKKDLLPSEEILEITTMCGHHMVSNNIVRQVAEKVKKALISPEEGGEKIASLCSCGIFNPERASMLLKKMTNK